MPLHPAFLSSLDTHLLFPLLEDAQYAKLKYELLERTKMIDYRAGLAEELDIKVDEHEQKKQRENVLNELEVAAKNLEPLLQIIQDPEVVDQLKQDKLNNIQFLQSRFEFDLEWIPQLHAFARLQYEIGAYGTASDLLYHFRILSTDVDSNTSATWGKLASDILTNNWNVAMEELLHLKDIIDSRGENPALQVQVLQERTWLLHWSLYVFFAHENGREKLVEMFFQPQYINTIQVAAPHIMRYLTAILLTHTKTHPTQMTELISIITHETYKHKDAITDYVKCLYADFDFERAQLLLRDCDTVLAGDYFLNQIRDEILESARLVLFQIYAGIHSRISTHELSARLNMDETNGEKWIVDNIRIPDRLGGHSRTAQIDCKGGQVLISPPSASLWDEVIDKVKLLSERSEALIGQNDKRQAALA